MSAQAAAANTQNTPASQKLKELGITLPEAKAPPGALYVPFSISGKQVIVSGQLPFKDGKLTSTGQVGGPATQAQGEEAAKACAINVLACLNQACGGNLDKVKKALKLEILVSSTPSFTSPQLVANGASKLIIDVFGEEKGRHARVAYGVASLPLDASVEVAATFELE